MQRAFDATARDIPQDDPSEDAICAPAPPQGTKVCSRLQAFWHRPAGSFMLPDIVRSTVQSH